MFGLKRGEAATHFNAVEVLVGLAPTLVGDLARLVGSTEDDLLVSFQVMPWGDRATLAAYGVIELGNDTSNRGRVIRVNPTAVELVNVAAEVLGDPGAIDLDSLDVSATEGDIEDAHQESLTGLSERAALLASVAVPLVRVVEDFEDNPAAKTVPGLVEQIDDSAPYELLQVSIPLTSTYTSKSLPAKGNLRVEVASVHRVNIKAGSLISLVYADDESPLDNPLAMKVEKI